MNLRSFRRTAFTAVLGLASTCSLAVAQTSSGTSSTSSGSTGGTTSSSSSGVGSGSGIGTSGSGSGTGTSGTGSTSPFAGNVASGFGTQSTSGMTSTGTTTSGSPTASNPFQSTYVNPYAVGVAAGNTTGSTSATKAFGAASLFVASTASKTSSLSTTTTVNSNSGQGFTTITLPKSIQYSTSLSEDVPLVAHVPSVMQDKLAGLLARSSMLRDRRQMRVDVQGNVVVLSGKAASERDREHAESILRLEPGVTEVVNQIQVAGLPNPNLPPLTPTSEQR